VKEKKNRNFENNKPTFGVCVCVNIIIDLSYIVGNRNKTMMRISGIVYVGNKKRF